MHQLTLFDPDVALSLRHRIFSKTALGQYHASLPLTELAALLPPPKTKVGAKPWFDNYGKIALQFLKAYQGCSDDQLLERLNTDWSLQLFCGLQLGPNQWIKDKDIIWKRRAWVALHLDQQAAQQVLINSWKPWMDNQQSYHFEHPTESIPNRIVSLYKPYLRPIVRGKENKRVEFGAKVNSWQVDGLNFIEHLSFKAFHEGIRLKQGVAFHYRNFGKLRQLGADQIYATNVNRRFCTKRSISTCFQPKGRRKYDPVLRRQQDQARRAIGKARSTVLEGSYGNDKNHYGLRKVKARNELTEVAWIFFGMIAANAVKIAKRKVQAAKAQARAA